ncbi:MAG: 5'-nucleotidase C-terminal domain-containing protein, partial [Bacteroidales bacterium]
PIYSTIVVTNDNDYGINSPNADGVAVETGNKWTAYMYYLPADKKIQGLVQSQPKFTLQLLHASDLEGGVEAIERAPLFTAVLDKLQREYDNTITISAGDNYIPSPFFGAASDSKLDAVLREVYTDFYGEQVNKLRTASGRIDVSIMNICGFDASAVGNHDFDAGTTVMREIINIDYRTTPELRWMGIQFPYLSANLDFSKDANLSPVYQDTILNNTIYNNVPSTITSTTYSRKIAPATYVVRNGEKIGIVGGTTQIVQSITSAGGVTVKGVPENNMDSLAKYIQIQIDKMRNTLGINKIIVVTHLQQIKFEKELVGKLSGVDILIAGGSDVLMAKTKDMLHPGHQIEENYPLITKNKDGEPALLVSADGQYSYVGRLIVDFDTNGVLDISSINPESGAYASLMAKAVELWGDSATAFAKNTKGELVQRLVASINNIVVSQDGNIFGKTNVYLNGDRSQVRSEETNFGNLSADANLWYAKKTDAKVMVSLKNGGGIRASIGEVKETSPGVYAQLPPQANPKSGKKTGEISQLDIANSLRFNNTLSIVSLTPAELKMILEHGVAAWTPTATPGQFCQIGGMMFTYDPSKQAQKVQKDEKGVITGIAQEGNRVQSIVIVDENNTITDVVLYKGKIMGDANRLIKMSVLKFTADGGDDYPFILTKNYSSKIDLPITEKTGDATFAFDGTEQDALAEYLKAKYSTTAYNVADTKISEDQRIQNLSVRNDGIVIKTPEITKPVDNISIINKANSKTVDLSTVFTIYNKPESQKYTIAYNEAILKISLSGNIVTVSGIAEGKSNVIIKTSDKFGFAVADTFEVTVTKNAAPVAVKNISKDTLILGQTSKTIQDIASYFKDEDNSILNYYVKSNNEKVVVATISNNNLILEQISEGTATITLEAADPVNSAKIEFTVTVKDTTKTSEGELINAELTYGPNPVREVLNIYSKSAVVSVTVQNTNGQIVVQTNNNNIKLSQLPQGLYLVKVETNNSINTFTVVKE